MSEQRLRFLEKRLKELVVLRKQADEKLAELSDRFEKADERRKTDNQLEAKKWNVIYRNLEGELDRAKAVLAKCDAEIKEKKEAYDDVKARFVAGQRAAKGPLTRENVGERLPTMTDEELAALSFEELEIVQEYELTHGAVTEMKEAVVVKPGEIEEAPAEPTDPAEKAALESARKKVADKNLIELTIHEANVMLDYCLALRMKSSPTVGERKALEELEAVLKRIDKSFGAWRRKLVKLNDPEERRW